MSSGRISRGKLNNHLKSLTSRMNKSGSNKELKTSYSRPPKHSLPGKITVVRIDEKDPANIKVVASVSVNIKNFQLAPR